MSFKVEAGEEPKTLALAKTPGTRASVAIEGRRESQRSSLNSTARLPHMTRPSSMMATGHGTMMSLPVLLISRRLEPDRKVDSHALMIPIRTRGMYSTVPACLIDGLQVRNLIAIPIVEKELLRWCPGLRRSVLHIRIGSPECSLSPLI